MFEIGQTRMMIDNEIQIQLLSYILLLTDSTTNYSNGLECLVGYHLTSV